MAINIGNYSFEGPYTLVSSLEDRSGVYVILCRTNSAYNVIDIGESATVRSRVENHDRANCWNRNCRGQLEYAVFYTLNRQQAGRKEIEQELRNTYKPPCGER